MSALDDLVAFAPPPENPRGAPFDWGAIEDGLGCRLPADYRSLCDAYGHGSFFAGSTFDLTMPESPSGFMALPEHELDFELEDSSWAAHPEPGGLLLLASTENHDLFWWRTDTWRVVHLSEVGEFTEIEATATETVLRTLRGDPPARWEGAGASAAAFIPDNAD